MTYRQSLYWESLKDSRNLGIHLVAGKGTGKSRFMGRLLSFADVTHGVPTVIIDPLGATINNLLDQIGTQPRSLQKKLWPRIRYIDMAGRGGYVVPTPLYYRMGTEGLYDVAARFTELIERLDPNLNVAPIQGMNAIRYVGIPLGIVLASLSLQITEAERLLANPDTWKDRLHRLQSRSDIERVVSFFTKEYSRSQAAMLRTKIADFTIDPVNRAIFSASAWGISWTDVVANNLCVLVDVSRDTNPRMRTLKMVWLFQSLLTYVQQKGLTREKPISLIIDELATMYRIGDETFSKEMDDLIHAKARNFNVWLTLAHQEMHQFDEQTQKVLMAMGTQIIGKTADPEAARAFAHRFDEYEPHWEKDTNKVWGSQSYDGLSTPVVLDERSIYFTPDEQERMESYKYLRQPPMQFFIKLAHEDRLRRMTLTGADVRRDINTQIVERDKDILMRLYGVSIEKVEQEIQARLSDKRLPLSTEPLDYEAPPGYDVQDKGSDDEDPLFQAPRT